MILLFFFFNDTATTEIYTLSLHDALPIWPIAGDSGVRGDDDGGAVPQSPAPHPVLPGQPVAVPRLGERARRDRKSTRLNSSHANISYAVFCLKKKKKN